MASNFAEAMQQGYGFGMQQRQDRENRERQSALSQLAAQSYHTPRSGQRSLLSEMALKSPEFAAQQEQQFNQQNDVRGKHLRSMAMAYQGLEPTQRANFYETRIRPEITWMYGDPGEFDEQAVAGVVKQVLASGMGAGEMPTGVREFELMTNAAGYKPGTPDYQQAARVKLGTFGRASSAGYSADTLDIGDGRKRPSRFNPRTGTQEYYDEGVGQWLQLGWPGGQGGEQGGVAAPQPPMAPGRPTTAAEDARFSARMNGIVRRLQAQNFTPEQIEAALPAFEEAENEASGAQMGNWGGADTPPIVPSRAPRGVGASRSKEEEAAAVRAAELRTDMDFAGRRAELDADAAFLKKQAEARATLEADIAATNSTRARDADTAIDLLDRAERLVKVSTGSGLGAKRDEWAAQFGESTPGGEAIAALRVLSGQLVSKMPRMEGPQSDADRLMYQQMAGDLANPNIPVPQRLAALRTIRDLQRKYQTTGNTVGEGGVPQGLPRAGEVRKGYRFKGGDPNNKSNWERL